VGVELHARENLERSGQVMCGAEFEVVHEPYILSQPLQVGRMSDLF
jgi:hypothetical protein